MKSDDAKNKNVTKVSTEEAYQLAVPETVTLVVLVVATLFGLLIIIMTLLGLIGPFFWFANLNNDAARILYAMSVMMAFDFVKGV